MSEEHTTKPTHKKEHGTTKSYIIGFILSLVFTFIPYYLVINKVIAGDALIAIILGIAVLQMAIQLLFFLHLGRGPKPLYNVVFFFATAGIIVVTIGASLMIMSSLYHNMSPQEVTVKVAQEENIAQVGGEKTGACSGVKESHIVTIDNGKVSPVKFEAKKCDSLTFVNEDDRLRIFAFGAHQHHDSYGGEDEIKVKKGHPETITLNQTGDFTFHDHLDESVTGQFSVEP